MRSLLWPIHRWEMKKLIPLFVLYALICFNYSILKIAKDSLVITAVGSGAEVLPFLKTWGILPMALLTMFLFTRLFNRFSQEKVFYIMTSAFIFFFLVFMLILYPMRDIIHPHALADHIQASIPTGFSGLIALFRNWSYTLFYIMSELWGTAIMSVLFWGFVNELTSVKDAKRFYSILLVGANIATICSAELTDFLTSTVASSSFLPTLSGEAKTIHLTITAVIVFGLLIMALFRWYQVKVVAQDPHMKKIQNHHFTMRKKTKMGLRQSFAFITKSKYLIFIAIIVVAFYLTNHMVEVIWKDQVKAIYPDYNSLTAYMAKVHRTIGALSAIIGLFFCGPLIRRLGWTLNALMTPLIMFATGFLFFGVVLWKDSAFLLNYSSAVGMTPLALGVLFGTLQNILSRGCKYTFFDATKEIAFIPLSRESKIKGKAAIDGVGSRLGKSGGAFLHQMLLMIFGTVSLTTPVVGIFLLLVTVGWFAAAQSLGRQFNRLTAQQEKVNIEEEAPILVEKPSNTRATV